MKPWQGTFGEALQRADLRKRLIQKIRDACPTPEQCDEVEERIKDDPNLLSCYDVHPIHWAVQDRGVITMIDARLEGLVDLIMEEVWPTTVTSTNEPS